MRAFGVILGILISILGGYAFFMEMDLFLRLGWLLGILFILAGVMLLVPKFKEIKLERARKKEQDLQVRKSSKKDQGKDKPKKDHTKTILGSISIIIGIVILISGASKTLTDLGTVYLVGACVMFFGIIQLSTLTKTPKEEEPEKPSKKRKKKNQEPEKKKESHKIMIVCCIVSLIIGGLAIYNSFISFVSVDKLIAYNIVMQGVNVVQIALDTYKKQIN